jgi:hypothetical protein
MEAMAATEGRREVTEGAVGTQAAPVKAAMGATPSVEMATAAMAASAENLAGRSVRVARVAKGMEEEREAMVGTVVRVPAEVMGAWEARLADREVTGAMEALKVETVGGADKVEGRTATGMVATAGARSVVITAGVMAGMEDRVAGLVGTAAAGRGTATAGMAATRKVVISMEGMADSGA